jgi:hypothetical protein
MLESGIRMNGASRKIHSPSSIIKLYSLLQPNNNTFVCFIQPPNSFKMKFTIALSALLTLVAATEVEKRTAEPQLGGLLGSVVGNTVGGLTGGLVGGLAGGAVNGVVGGLGGYRPYYGYGYRPFYA